VRPRGQRRPRRRGQTDRLGKVLQRRPDVRRPRLRLVPARDPRGAARQAERDHRVLLRK
jgi:hypothetical protein